MEKSYHKAHCASGSKLKIEGVINCNISFWGKTGKVKANIVQRLSLNLQFLTYGMNRLIPFVSKICQ